MDSLNIGPASPEKNLPNSPEVLSVLVENGMAFLYTCRRWFPA
jgi:hypothetical protein